MLDLDALGAAIQAHDKVARIVLVQVKGSAPRTIGTSMLIWETGSSGTIGGGQLEWQSMREARAMLTGNTTTKLRHAALGPALNQCCGGAVSVVTEVFDTESFAAIPRTDTTSWARPVGADAGDMPDSLKRKLHRAKDHAAPLPLTFQGGWLAEALWRKQRQVIIYGAGHVGRALADILAPLAQFQIHLADTRAGYLDDLCDAITPFAGPPTDLMATTEPDAMHFIMTPEHDFDLELCHHLLGREFGFAGLIGSATKWARFRKRLAALGHAIEKINQITCPIGDPRLGKQPHAIAVGIAAQMLAPEHAKLSQKEALV